MGLLKEDILHLKKDMDAFAVSANNERSKMRFKTVFIGLMLLSMIFVFGNDGFAQNIRDLEARIERLEHAQEEANMLDGLNLGVGATFVIQGTSNANGSSIGYKGNDTTDAAYSMDLELEKEFDNGGMGFVHFETGQSDGVTDDLEVFSNVNADADASGGILTLTEIWYEQNFDDNLLLTFGKINLSAYIDNNEYANDECSQFLSSIFKNSPVIEFPDNTIGIRSCIAFTQMVDVELAVLDGDADFQQIGDHPFLAAQITVKPQLINRNGNYRLLFWLNEAPHTKWNDAGKTKESASGFGISCDQELVDNIGAFLRAGWQSDDAALDTTAFSLESSYSAGLQFGGGLWGRDDDVLGMAYGIINPSDEYKKAGSLQAKTENHFEVYYNYKLNDNVAITPDIQVIGNPYGKDAANGTSSIIVAGIRMQLDF
ncbi:MAG: carbohydrate porin [Candidatus Omnitrophica bacterium]|nr:carbohydrate porin [Candidatus Omnitrophota bacterium]